MYTRWLSVRWMPDMTQRFMRVRAAWAVSWRKCRAGAVCMVRLTSCLVVDVMVWFWGWMWAKVAKGAQVEIRRGFVGLEGVFELFGVKRSSPGRRPFPYSRVACNFLHHPE